MERYIMNDYSVSALVHAIGCEIDGILIVDENCADTLQELLTLLQGENPHTCQVRRQLGLANFVPKVLVPMLLHLSDQEVENEEEIFALTIKLMTNLTQPVDCLLPSYLMGQSSYSQVVADISSMLVAIKECFLGPQLTAGIVGHMTTILKQDDPLSMKHCETLNQCLYLFRNILITPETEVPIESPLGQLSTLWYMFQAGFHDILLRILASKQLPLWCVAMVQLISLMYKDEICEEEDEQAGHQMDKMTGDQNSLVSDSNSSDFQCANGTCKSINIDNIVLECPSEAVCDNQSTFVNVSSHASEQGSNQDIRDDEKDMASNASSTSNGGTPDNDSKMDTMSAPAEPPVEDAYDEKIPVAPMNEKMSQCMDDLVTEINTKLINFKLREYLLDFTERFLKEGFPNLLKATREHLLFSRNSKLPDLYFLWMVGYFLKYVVRFKTPFKSVSSCLSVDIMGHIIYSGVQSCEEILQAQKNKEEVSPKLKRLELIVTALQSVFFVLDYLEKQPLEEDDKEHLHQLFIGFLRSVDLRNYFIMIIRKFDPKLQTKNFLSNVVVTNHQYLLLAEKVQAKDESQDHFNMLDQIQKFATVKIMNQYAWLLENHSSNSLHVNECIFTMMYHVAGDCGKPKVLVQLPIVKTFVDIWDSNQLLTTESYDLMNFILQCFLHEAQTNPSKVAEIIATAVYNDDEKSGLWKGLAEKADLESVLEEDCTEWSLEELDIVFEVTLDEENPAKLVEDIQNRLREQGYTRTNKELMLQLFHLGHWSREELEAATGITLKENTITTSEKSENVTIEVSSMDIEKCVEYLSEKSMKQLTWLQHLLLETCYVKMGGRYLGKRFVPEEVVILHYALSNASIPIIPYTEDQETAITNPVFIQLLHRMGFHLPDDVKQLWPRIPHFWTPDILAEKAQMLGEIDYDYVKFREDELHMVKTDSTMDMPPFVPDLDPMVRLQSKEDKMVMSDYLWQIFVYQQSRHNQQVEKMDHNKVET